ncbi:hypothetical protein BKK79_00750 [Cupriavidus sp. USMAA2-4]|uniref:hypothetical protein n=1 Tax=Cupriavidus sp. USMAA2-4 TaxID=876364 RepID=UPI0008A6B829|nr:hypothetical protein [Cupriavidus sp. USMAA2-4]AOY90518.1 hypothetical protein BKK79_00750 [Cupriavidus sp. USMAA2-4]
MTSQHSLRDPLLAELKASHVIIQNALNLMTIDQKCEWGRQNDAAGLVEFGSTRANERAAVIAAAESAALSQPQSQAQGEAVACKRCGGSGFVDDGEITGCGGVEFENGPVRCVKDCPNCAAPAPSACPAAPTDRVQRDVMFILNVLQDVNAAMPTSAAHRITTSNAIEKARALLASQPSEARVAEQDCRQDPFAAVMNLPCIVPVEYEDAAVKMAYRVGHRDARHAAAELLSAPSTDSAAARDAERLMWLVEEEAMIVTIPVSAGLPRYRVEWPSLYEQQSECFADPRAAIDSAIAALAAQREGGA